MGGILPTYEARGVFDDTEAVQVLILGGGRGQRLYPLTATRSKPAVPFGGKYRLIDIPMSNCLNSRLSKIFVLTQFNSASLNRHIWQAYQFGSLTRGFVEILAAQQTMDNSTWYQGTADAVRQNLGAIESRGSQYVLILAGDHLYRMDYRPFLRAHVDWKADVSVAVHPAKRREASDLGIVRIDETGRIVEFHEKPRDPKALSRLAVRTPGGPRRYPASMGIYIFNHDVLPEVLADTSQTDFGKEIIPACIGKYRVMGYPFDGYWRDIGTIRSFYDANIEMVAPIPPFNFYDTRYPIFTRVRAMPPSKINQAVIEQCLVSDGCVVTRAELRNTVVGVRATIRPQSRIFDSVLLGADFYEDELQRPPGQVGLGIGEGTHIARAIIDKNARIGDNVQIINRQGLQDFDGPNYVIRDGIVIIPKNAVIEPGTII
ncbi:MAG TPA: glucose-1-phosphate adenylyltransferase [Planctomycetota bacterium]|nr:glucose-1-phosphate adenylyltransferase [Planctomycetota bacterium]